MTMPALDLSVVPSCRQELLIKTIARTLWAEPEVESLWLGGSFGRRDFDDESDLDFRALLQAGGSARLMSKPLDALLGAKLVGETRLNIGQHELRHCLTSEGFFVDLFLISSLDDFPPEQTMFLGAKSPSTAKRVQELGSLRLQATAPRASTTAIIAMLTDFWMTSAKHRKPMSRGFNEMVPFGLHGERLLVLKLAYILVTGEEPHNSLFVGIHGLRKILAAARASSPRDLVDVFGLPLRSREEILTCIEAHRDLVSLIGKQLAQKYGFDYPSELEATVRHLFPTGAGQLSASRNA